jgi:hypothetical protein
MPKGRKTLTPRKQFNNLCEALAEDALRDKAAPKNEAPEGQLRDHEAQSWAEKAKRKSNPKKTR